MTTSFVDVRALVDWSTIIIERPCEDSTEILVITRLMATPRKPGVRAFATIGGIEALVRGVALSVYPILMYRAWGDAVVVSQWYFGIGVVSLMTGLMAPTLIRHLSQRWLWSAGALLFVVSAGLGMLGGKLTTVALLCHVIGTASIFVCFNAYVLDNVPSAELGRLESLRMLFGGFGWTVGPVLGVWLIQFWHGAPFVIIGLGALAMLAAFWRMGIARARSAFGAGAGKAGSFGLPLGYLRQFLRQPRLMAGWLFVVIRSCGWWVYTVYVGIFALQAGLGAQVGGIASSLGNIGLFMAPLMLRWMHRHSLAFTVRTGFLVSGACFILATLVSPLPWIAVAVLMLASWFLVLLDVSAGLPFLMSVKPSQRAEMSAVYSSFRDVSGIVTPGLAWLILLFSPLAGVFAAAGLLLLTAWAVAGRIHPQLGVPRRQRVRSRR